MISVGIIAQFFIGLGDSNMSVGLTIQDFDVLQFIKRCKVFVLFLILMNNICYLGTQKEELRS